MLVFFISALSEVHANTENEKKSKNDPKTGEKATKKIDIDYLPNSTEKRSATTSKAPHFQAQYPNQEDLLSSQDQNAVLSFNFVQYIFQQFKFSEKTY